MANKLYAVAISYLHEDSRKYFMESDFVDAHPQVSLQDIKRAITLDFCRRHPVLDFSEFHILLTEVSQEAIQRCV